MTLGELIMKKSINRYTMTILSAILLLTTYSPFIANANDIVDENTHPEEVLEIVKQYITADGNEVHFDVEHAQKDKQSEFVLEIGRQINAINNAYANEGDLTFS